MGGSRKAMSESILKEDRRTNCAVLCLEAQRNWPFVELLVVCSKHTCESITHEKLHEDEHGNPRNMTYEQTNPHPMGLCGESAVLCPASQGNWPSD